ncbi:uncharacterized protein LOC129586498 [Paramacrobiotus metropolitanus]|uniref:uncharacterized protein LOC129586498 n=1 Tax=Paramacrobiotus metropolitanus TaxID=2943436 RepID=UPI002446437B|nr:uncharacterized protein LOC129586498 [Paramacrobiotus metropolitanus]
MPQTRARTLKEAKDIFEELTNRPHREIDIVCLPPEAGVCSDTEDIDENDLRPQMPKDVAEDLDVCYETDSEAEEVPAPKRKKGAVLRPEVDWKPDESAFVPFPENAEGPPSKLANEHPELISKTPLELFKMYFDDIIAAHIITESERYAKQDNADFQLPMRDLFLFIGILLYSGIVQLPTTRHFWMRSALFSFPAVSSKMSCKRFEKIKRYLHLADNDNLDPEDKMAKVNPFFALLQEKLLQFGIFDLFLSVDEEMIPYFGHHSCKMFMRGKPCRFGYKLWVLCGSRGYPYTFYVYTGKDATGKDVIEPKPLGSRVVLNLLSVVKCPDAHSVFFDNFFTSYGLLEELRALGFRATAAPGLSKSTTGWSEIEVNPNAFLSAIYKGFRINVYVTKQILDVNSTHYFYPPGLFIDPMSAKSYLNTLQNRFEMSFTVLMWDEDYEAFIRNAVSTKLGSEIPKENIRVLPIEQIRIEAPGLLPSTYEMVNQWMSYASQPSTFEFRFSCINKATCDDLAQQMRENPQYFVYDLQVSYSLIAQRSARRIIQVKAEHVQAGQLYSRLKQDVPNTDVVYMQADDLTQMTLEIANNVMATEVVDDEFIGQDQSLTITKILESLMQVKPESTASFQAQMWDSVFWQEENTRPDRVTSTMNEYYNKVDDQMKDTIKETLNQASSTSVDVSVDADVFWGMVEAGVNTAVDTSDSFASNYEREQFKSTLREAAGKSQWNGEKIIVKPMTLMRTNTARLNSATTVTSVQVRVTKSAAELTSRINLFADYVYVPPEPLYVETENATFSATPTGSVQMFYGEKVPSGWLLCDGSQVDCRQYRRLCNVLPIVNGTRALPNFEGRIPVGSGTACLPRILHYNSYASYECSEREFGQAGESVQYYDPSNSTGSYYSYKQPYHAVKFIIKT